MDNVKEENDEAINDENEQQQQPEAANYYLSQKRPLLGKSSIKYIPNKFDDEEDGDTNSDHNDTLIDTLVNTTNDNAFSNNRLELKTPAFKHTNSKI